MDIVLPVIAGLVIGFLIGLTGMGGGALMTPFLLLVMNLDPILAVGTDLTFAAITKTLGGIQHRREKNVSIKKVFWLAVGSIPASFLSAQFILRQTENRAIFDKVLPNILGVTLIIVSVIIMARAFHLLRNIVIFEMDWPPSWALIIIGAFGGLLVGMTSIGGGTVIMALLLIFFSIPLNQLVGVDVTHGALLAMITAINYILAGQTDFILVGLLLIGSLPGVWLGARAVNRIDLRIIRGVLAVMIVAAGIELLFR
jgi:uncharacterized membrane protein YfcA